MAECATVEGTEINLSPQHEYKYHDQPKYCEKTECKQLSTTKQVVLKIDNATEVMTAMICNNLVKIKKKENPQKCQMRNN